MCKKGALIPQNETVKAVLKSITGVFHAFEEKDLEDVYYAPQMHLASLQLLVGMSCFMYVSTQALKATLSI